jgi:F0F1-type ATP synthase membrane subunit b/b'
MEISPTFWVAFSFFVFIALSWNTLRSSFLNAIHAYKTDIASNLSDIYAQKNNSEEYLEQSQKELADSISNSYVLNAHKVAKSIAEASKEKVAYIRRTVNSDMKASMSGLEIFFQEKTKKRILELSSKVVEQYINAHKSEFNALSIKKIKETFSS